MVISNNYLNLLTNYSPRLITSDRKLAETQKRIDSLLNKPQLSQDESDYLNVLGTLVCKYEEIQEIIPDLYGVELVKALLSEFGKQKDLVSIFKTESIVSDILNNKRQLNARHIQNLAEFFHLSPTVFFPG